MSEQHSPTILEIQFPAPEDRQHSPAVLEVQFPEPEDLPSGRSHVFNAPLNNSLNVRIN